MGRDPRGRLEGGGRGRRKSLRVEAKARLLVAAPPPQHRGPASPAPSCPNRVKALSGQGPVVWGLAPPGGRGRGLPSPVCRVLGDAGHRLISVSRPPSLSPCLCISLSLRWRCRPVSLSVFLCVSRSCCPTGSRISESMAPIPVCLSVSESLSLAVSGSLSASISRFFSPSPPSVSQPLFLAVSGREEPRPLPQPRVPDLHPPGFRAGVLSSEAEG